MQRRENDQMPKMVGWYDPGQLLDTARKTAISTIIGENADPRLVTAAATGGKFFDYSQNFRINNDGDFEPNGTERKEIWIDYVSDVGDGWNPTYSIAYTLAQEKLTVRGEKTERGEILIFGGDGVYPTATSNEYEEKMVKPYRCAFNASRNGNADDKGDLKKNPHVFVLPGNHDWYDSLVAFQKLFCTHIFNQRVFASGWRTRQKRSYFALKLPQNWWLLGIDLQLSHNIDVRQLQYFESVIKKMQKGDKAILCVPEPYWVKVIKYGKMTDKFKEKEESIERLERLLSDCEVETKLYVAGDLHHYRRFVSRDGRRVQKITAGGGGAFLHPTHDFDFHRHNNGLSEDQAEFTFEEQYPEAEVSKKLDWKNLYGFIFNNPSFGLLTGFMYVIVAFLLHGEMAGEFTWTKAVSATAERIFSEPLSFVVVVLMLLGLLFFTDSNSKPYRIVAGTIHGLAHLAAIFFLSWLGYRLALWLPLPESFGMQTSPRAPLADFVLFACIALVSFTGGYVVGSFLMGIYLFVSLHIFGRHDNEAFSALKIEDYKNFIRLHIDANGNLTIYPVKIERVARDWERAENGGGEFYKPKPDLKPELIEDKITV